MYGSFSRGWNIIIPSGDIFFSHPRVFGLNGRAPDSVRAGQWVKPRLSGVCFFGGFSMTFLPLLIRYIRRQLSFLFSKHYLVPRFSFFVALLFFSSAVGISPGICFVRIFIGIVRQGVRYIRTRIMRTTVRQLYY